MKMGDALNQIQEFYIPGSIQFYTNLTPDPWQSACDRFDAEMREALEHRSQEKESRACLMLLTTLRRLTENYAKLNLQAQEMTIPEAFLTADERAVERSFSMSSQSCIHCLSKNDLALKCDKSSTRHTFFICQVCIDDGKR